MGDRVQAGPDVIKLDEREARLEVERLSANLQAARESLGRSHQVLESSRANVDRAEGRPGRCADSTSSGSRDLFGDGAISASQRDSAQTQYDVAGASLRVSEAQYESDRAAVKNAEASVVQATAALAIARKRLQDTNVGPPINGVVRKRLVNVGETFQGEDAADESGHRDHAEAARRRPGAIRSPLVRSGGRCTSRSKPIRGRRSPVRSPA